jgi:hypothetical protein
MAEFFTNGTHKDSGRFSPKEIAENALSELQKLFESEHV